MKAVRAIKYFQLFSITKILVPKATNFVKLHGNVDANDSGSSENRLRARGSRKAAQHAVTYQIFTCHVFHFAAFHMLRKLCHIAIFQTTRSEAQKSSFCYLANRCRTAKSYRNLYDWVQNHAWVRPVRIADLCRSTKTNYTKRKKNIYK